LNCGEAALYNLLPCLRRNAPSALTKPSIHAGFETRDTLAARILSLDPILRYRVYGESRMLIGELAEQAGVNVQTVRFYERRKLLPEPSRTHSGYREYGEQELKQLRFIRQAKALGFTLDEIRDIIRNRGRGQCPCTDVITIADRHLRDINEQIQTLERFKNELTTAVRQWKRAGKQNIEAGAICTLIERTMRERGASQRRTNNGKR